MLAVAADRATAENLSIEWIESLMESMPVPDERVDLIVGSQALQFCSDRQAAVSEMYRVLDDGGRVVLSFFQAIEKMPVWTQFSVSLEKHLGTPVTQVAFSLDAAEAQSILAEAGFSNIAIEPYEYTMRHPNADDYAAMQVPGAAAVAGTQQMSEDELSNLISVIQQEMQPTIAEFTEDGQLMMPAFVYIARAVRS
jgi:ubiquinone/menaquinone biosynthesis C-methylase UbiE